MNIIQDSFTVKQQPMICGSSEAEQRTYTMHTGKSGKRWLVANQPDAGANVYVEGGPNSQGFGGRTLTFHLTNGDTIELKGPWHSNCSALFSDTGVDVRDKHYTFVVIGLNRTSDEKHRSVLQQIIYIDKEPTLGPFNRGDIIAKQIANKLNQTIYLYSQSQGGSSCGPVNPDELGE